MSIEEDEVIRDEVIRDMAGNTYQTMEEYKTAVEKLTNVPNIYQRMNAVMRDLTIVSKERFQKFDKFNYVGHDDVTAPLHPLFVKHGIVQRVSQTECIRTDDKMLKVCCQISWINIDSPDDRVVIQAWGEASANRSDKRTGDAKGDDLQIGKAVSYAIKVAQLKNFMLVGGDIDDNEASSGKESSQDSETMERGFGGINSGVEQEVMIAFLERYLNAKDKPALSTINADIQKILHKMTEKQENELAAAYQKAAERIAAK